MFEDSLFASRVGVVSAAKRWTVAASVVLQMALAAVVIVIPLVHPEGLPMQGSDAPKVLMPVIPKPPVRVVVTEHETSASASTAPSVPTLPHPAIPTIFPMGNTAANDAPEISSISLGMEDGGAALPPGIVTAVGPSVSLAPTKSPGPLHISTLSEGMLLAPIRPVYPAIARTAGIQGTVVVEAVISRTGSIESLRVVSGPLMLQNAALEAIREAKYKPYKLNGQPVEVQTTITVNFRIGG
jgi:periplasmic protein TonB